ncbi:PREDICTED: tetratricopeptide repeat protein 36 homolog [Dinoponera quadriceps]|uniref:Tetratricopeptide repeat protein 36 homolog n=1 Tax=Dinoponera quadriceps TaxID=609295 RepID=A0A6P3XC95_DINQU|nr:PREDICTED: tetratricopeptide repeat protein 36 homolog [Dinoponera quadriceps]
MEGLSEGDRAVLTSIFDPLQPLGLSDFPQELETTAALEDDCLEPQVLDTVKRAIVCAEAKNFDESFRLFDEALTKAPESSAILNDRAQALRLANRHEEALKDLHLAVELSGGKGKAGVQALCQRGALYRWMERDEKATEDFSRAAKAGSNFARSQLVALNPYAAMCNAMLREITCKASYP